VETGETLQQLEFSAVRGMEGVKAPRLISEQDN
jgi:hypothetical protein